MVSVGNIMRQHEVLQHLFCSGHDHATSCNVLGHIGLLLRCCQLLRVFHPPLGNSPGHGRAHLCTVCTAMSSLVKPQALSISQLAWSNHQAQSRASHSAYAKLGSVHYRHKAMTGIMKQISIMLLVPHAVRTFLLVHYASHCLLAR